MTPLAKKFIKFTGWLHRHKFGAVLGLIGVISLAGITVTHAVDITLLSPFVSIIPFSLALILSIIASVIGKLIIIIIGMVVIPILGYNGFATSGVVDIGWPLVRDVVNMFVVVVLLVIAVKTILGVNKASWEQQLPKLFLAIVAVNFSRTICLLLIDVGQVVMWTFVSAIRDIAAGNFVNLFQLNSMMAVGDAFLNAQGNSGLNALGYLGAAYATVVFMAMVLAVMLLLAAIFIYRIVILWVLIIMSPLAFFLGGVKDIIGSAGGGYDEWWKKMVGAITLGPILTFFLWLALAAASSGPVATSEGFSTVASSDTEETLAALPTEIFQMDKFLSLFIAIVLIMVGFQAASSQAGALGGIAAQFVNEQGGKKLARGLAAAPAALGYRAGRAVAVAGRAVAVEGARQLERRTGVGKAAGGALIQAASSLRQVPLVGGVAARNLAAAGGGLQKLASADEKEARKNAEERIGNMSDDQKTEMISAIASGNLKKGTLVGAATFGRFGKAGAVSLDSKDEIDAVMTDYMKNKSTRDEYKASLKASGLDDAAVDAKMQEMNKKVIDFYSDEATEQKFVGDDQGKKDALLKFRTANLHQMNEKNADGTDKLDASGKPIPNMKARQKVVDDDKFNPANLSAGAIKDDSVREMLKNKTTRTYTDKDGNRRTETAWDNVSRGIGVGDEIKKALPEVLAKEIPKMTSEQLERALKSGTVKMEMLQPSHLNTPDQAQKIARAIIDAGQSLDANQIKGTGPEADAAREKFKNAATAELNKDRLSARSDEQLSNIDKRIMQVTGSMEKAHGVGIDAAGNAVMLKEGDKGYKPGGDKTLAINVKQDVTYINKLPASVTSAPGGDVAKAITSQVEEKDISAMINKMYTADKTERDQIREALTKLQSMAQAQQGKHAPMSTNYTRLGNVDQRIGEALAIPESSFT
jgi:hypothetical protein